MDDSVSSQEEALVRFAAAMDAIGVEYMVTGSTALNFYAQPRMTRDIDIVIDAKPSDRRFVIDVLTADFEADEGMIRDAFQRQGMFNILAPGDVKIDVIVRDRNIHPDETLVRRRRFVLQDQEIKIISPEDLVVAKLYWARDSRSDMQLRDVRNLLASPDIDLKYIELRVRQMGLAEIWKEAQ